MKRLALLALILPVLGGCGPLLNLNLMFTGEQTSLESQVLGAYGRLDDDLAAYSSVRAVQPDGTLAPPRPVTSSQAAALLAMQNRQYNRDDVELLLANRIVGERSDGMLERLVAPLPPVDRITPQLVEQIVAEENADRAVLIERLMRTTPGVTEGQRPDVAWIFATTNIDRAPAGALVMERTGQWRTK